MQKLAEHFIPAADQVDRLQQSSDADALLFQKFANQGHTRDVGVRGLGRQGTYAVTPSGRMLASVNSPEAKDVIQMMEQALEQWEKLSSAERLLPKPLDPKAAAQWRWWDKHFPKEGLVLRVMCRDLPRENISPQWQSAWGLDHAWFQKEEARAFVPRDLSKGATHSVPRLLVERLARFHLVDSVRGRETLAFPPEAIQEAWLNSEIIQVEGPRLQIRLEGASRTFHTVDLFDDNPAAQKRGFSAKLLGQATYDTQQQKFTRFELLAVGQRTGATSCNMRIQDNDIGPAPMGVILTLAGDSPADQVHPAFLSQYGWK